MTSISDIIRDTLSIYAKQEHEHRIRFNLIPSSMITRPKTVIITPPVIEDKKIEKVMKATKDYIKSIVNNSVHKVRKELLACLRGEDKEFYNRKLFIREAWVNLKDVKAYIEARGQTWEVVYNLKDMDVKDEYNEKWVCAIFGHKSEVAMIRYYGKFVPYNGPHSIFYFTHTSIDGLGVLNMGRTLNVLMTRDRLQSKGVIAKVDIKKHNIEVWSKIGDRYGNTVACFDHNLASCIDEIIYDDNYMDNITVHHKKDIDFYVSKGMTVPDSISKVKSLIITFDDEDDEDDEGKDDEGKE